MFRPIFSCLAILFSSAAFATPAAAQSLSAADILAKVEEKVGGGNEFQALLNDPDPARSMAAMEVMLESGDAKLVRMALDFGLYSPNPVVQRMALDGFFAASPNLGIYFSGEVAAKDNSYRSNIEGQMRGSVDSKGVGFVTLKVGAYSPERQCYFHDRSDSDCFLSVTDSGVAMTLLQQTGILRLNDAGELSGEISWTNVDGVVTLRVPVSN